VYTGSDWIISGTLSPVGLLFGQLRLQTVFVLASLNPPIFPSGLQTVFFLAIVGLLHPDLRVFRPLFDPFLFFSMPGSKTPLIDASFDFLSLNFFSPLQILNVLRGS